MSRERAPGPHRQQQRGFVLIVGLLILVVMTLLSLSMFRSFGLQERIAGNTREKQRALETAQSALQYGEWWLNLGSAGTGVGATCNSGTTNANQLAQMKICANALANPIVLPWPARAEYQPPQMAVEAGGGVATGGDINYLAKPGLYINYLALAPDGRSPVYQVSAYGYGGSASTAAVVQSTYELKSPFRPLDGL
jgi:type IV pilus assembly protein PilX